MNKKLPLLILSTYLTTTIIPTTAFAEANLNESTVAQVGQNENKDSITDIDSSIKISKEYVNISFVDLDGKELTPAMNYEDVYKDLLTHPDTDYVRVTPKNIENYTVSYVEINGVKNDFTSDVYLPFLKTETEKKFTIKYVYEPSETAGRNGSGKTLFINTSLANNIEDILNHFGTNTIDFDHHNLSFGINGEDFKVASSNLSSEFLTVSSFTRIPTHFENPQWFIDFNNQNKILTNFELSSNSTISEIGNGVEVSYLLEKNDTNSSKKELFVYELNEQTKEVRFITTLERQTDVTKEGNYVYKGLIDGAYGGIFVISPEEISKENNNPSEENKPSEDTSTENNSNNNTETNKPSTEKPSENKPNSNLFDGPYGQYDSNGYGKFSVSKKAYLEYIEYLKGLEANESISEVELHESFLVVNGTDGNKFGLKLRLDNLKNVFAKNSDKDILIEISGEVSGTAKIFAEKYSKEILGKATIKSSALNSFNSTNIVGFTGDNNYHYYLVSNDNNSKVEYLGQAKTNEPIHTKSDLNNKTVFAVKSKIELTEKGELPFAGGTNQAVLVAGGVLIVAASGFVILGKRKKKDNE